MLMRQSSRWWVQRYVSKGKYIVAISYVTDDFGTAQPVEWEKTKLALRSYMMVPPPVRT